MGGRHFFSIVEAENARSSFSQPPYQVGCGHKMGASPFKCTHSEGQSGSRREASGGLEKPWCSSGCSKFEVVGAILSTADSKIVLPTPVSLKSANSRFQDRVTNSSDLKMKSSCSNQSSLLISLDDKRN